ncbi:rod shape-determining protein RodA [Candidatus Poribacteria bacterium]|nr:rod shape-determining protein RodA [Candidatus Poribacteria bacterium]
MSFLDSAQEIGSSVPRTRPAGRLERMDSRASRPAAVLQAMRHLDLPLLSAAIGLACLGMLALAGSAPGSAVMIAAVDRQVVWLGISLVMLSFMLVIDYHWLGKVAPVAYIANLVLLVLVLVMGTRVNGASSWFRLGPAGFQPAETMKIITVVMLANWLALRPEGIRRWRDLAGPVLLCAAPVLLILRQPDLGTASLFGVIFVAMIFWAGTRPRILVTLLVGAALTASCAYPFLKTYQKERILTFLDPSRDPQGAGYNVIQSMIAVGSGGLAGRGFGEGTQSVHRYLPEAHTDFIFASAVEQTGLLGAVVILSLFAVVFWRLLRTVGMARDRFGGLMVIGLGGLLAAHVILNIGMTIGLLPVMGVPLPFMSYGGSFLVTTFAIVGLALNVSMRRWVFGQ